MTSYVSTLLISTLICVLAPSQVQAQISSDGTLNTPTRVTPENLDYIITDGTSIGQNLFHSFQEFSVPTGGSVFFDNASNIVNIFSRVTGSQVSNIDGFIQNSGIASLFLINPNGIIFGPNASIDIQGSFIASTASSINFADGTQFSTATNGQTLPLLSVSVPVGLQFGTAAQPIQVQGTQLTILPGKTLVLLGGDVSLVGSELLEDRFNLQAPGGRIEIGSVSSHNTVSLIPVDRGWALGYDSVQNFQNITLSQRTSIDVSDFSPVMGGEEIGSGNVRLTAKQVTLTEGSQISSFNFGEKSAGEILIEAAESIKLAGAGTIADGLEISTNLSTNTLGNGQAGNITLIAKQLIIQDGAGIFSSSEFLDAENPSQFGGRSGNITVLASESVEISGSSSLVGISGLTVSTETAGDAGNLNIITGRLIVQDGGTITARTSGAGQGGNITISTSESIDLSGMGINVDLDSQGDIVETTLVPSALVATSEGLGNAGSINITTNLLSVTDGAEINVSSFGMGNAGDININAQSILLNNQGKLTAQSVSGEGGNIRLNLQDFLILLHNSQISTQAGTPEAGGGGNGGNIDITAQFIIAVPNEDSNIDANAFEGNGGNINITATGIFGIEPRGELTDLSDITASSQFGQVGTLALNRPDVDPQSSLVKLPETVVDAQQLVIEACSPGGAFTQGEFVITGRGGLPPGPNDLVQTQTGLTELGYPNTNDRPQTRSPLPETPSVPLVPTQAAQTETFAIVEAQGWRTDERGRIVLTAQASTVTPHRLRFMSPTCYDLQSSTQTSPFSPADSDGRNRLVDEFDGRSFEGTDG